jgi:hypothetical protein
VWKDRCDRLREGGERSCVHSAEPACQEVSRHVPHSLSDQFAFRAPRFLGTTRTAPRKRQDHAERHGIMMGRLYRASPTLERSGQTVTRSLAAPWKRVRRDVLFSRRSERQSGLRPSLRPTRVQSPTIPLGCTHGSLETSGTTQSAIVVSWAGCTRSIAHGREV